MALMKHRTPDILVRILAAFGVVYCIAPVRQLRAAPIPARESENVADVADDPSPVLLPPEHAVWPGVVLIVIIALFVTAAVAGPIIRANTRDELAESEAAKP